MYSIDYNWNACCCFILSERMLCFRDREFAEILSCQHACSLILSIIFFTTNALLHCLINEVLYIVYVVWQVRVTAVKDAVTIETFSITAELIFPAKNIKLHGFIYFRFEWTKFVTFYWHGLQRFYRSARNEQVWIPQAFSTCERFIWKLFIFWIRWFHGGVLLSAVEGTRN